MYYNIFRNSYELEALQETLAEVKNSINTQNVNKFENCVEVHMKHIQSGLSQVSNNLRKISNQINNIIKYLHYIFLVFENVYIQFFSWEICMPL